MRIVVTGKGIDILKGLENIYFMGRKLKVSYYDKYGNSTERLISRNSTKLFSVLNFP